MKKFALGLAALAAVWSFGTTAAFADDADATDAPEAIAYSSVEETPAPDETPVLLGAVPADDTTTTDEATDGAEDLTAVEDTAVEEDVMAQSGVGSGIEARAISFDTTATGSTMPWAPIAAVLAFGAVVGSMLKARAKQ